MSNRVSQIHTHSGMKNLHWLKWAIATTLSVFVLSGCAVNVKLSPTSHGFRAAFSTDESDTNESSGVKLYDRTGRRIGPPDLDNACDFREGFSVVRKGTKYGYLKSDGQYLVAPRFEDAWNFHEGMALVKSNGNYGFIDTKGQVVIEPEFEDAWDFSDGIAMIQMNGKCGFIDRSGKIVIEPQYDAATGFNGGIAAVEKGDRDYAIDKQGNWLFEIDNSVTDWYPSGELQCRDPVSWQKRVQISFR